MLSGEDEVMTVRGCEGTQRHLESQGGILKEEFQERRKTGWWCRVGGWVAFKVYSGWPTQDKLNAILADFLNYYFALFCLFCVLLAF